MIFPWNLIFTFYPILFFHFLFGFLLLLPCHLLLVPICFSSFHSFQPTIFLFSHWSHSPSQLSHLPMDPPDLFALPSGTKSCIHPSGEFLIYTSEFLHFPWSILPLCRRSHPLPCSGRSLQLSTSNHSSTSQASRSLCPELRGTPGSLPEISRPL